MTRPNTQSCPVCECTFESGDCVHIAGSGRIGVDPYVATPIFDTTDDDNMMEEGPAGIGAFAPPWMLNPPAAHVYSLIDAPIGYDVLQVLILEETRYDTDSMVDPVDFRLIIKTPGVYLVTLNVRWKKQTVDSGDVAAFIRVDGGAYIASDSMRYGDADLFNSQSLSVEYEFEAGQYIQALVKQDGILGDDAVVGTILSDHRLPSFSATFLRPATS